MASFRPSVVLLDLGLPGMSGIDVAKKIREQHEVRPLLVAVTGYGRDQDRDEAQRAGFDRHMTKPLDVNTLRAMLEAARRRSA
jgi:DNA-binding response OmpR family regulator